MAEIDINAGFERSWDLAGGRFIIDPAEGGTGGATDTLVLNNIVDGTLSIEAGLRGLLEPFRDRGVMATDLLEGEENPTVVSIDCLLTSASYDASDILGLAQAPGANGFAKKMQLAIFVPDVRGGTAGDSIVLNHAIFQRPQPILRAASNERTTFTASWLCLVTRPTITPVT